MLGLPSTTDVGRVLPKKAFYEHLGVSGKIKDDFVHKIERIVIENSIKPKTANIPAGENVPEVMVVRVELRQREVPEAVLKLVAEKNAHKLVFVCVYEEEACLVVLLKSLVVGPWQSLDNLALEVRGENMDAFWDSLASQVVYGDVGMSAGANSVAGTSANPDVSPGGVFAGMSVEERFARDQRIAKLREEIVRLDKRCRKEKQINRKNELFAQVKRFKAELAELEG